MVKNESMTICYKLHPWNWKILQNKISNGTFFIAYRFRILFVFHLSVILSAVSFSFINGWQKVDMCYCRTLLPLSLLWQLSTVAIEPDLVLCLEKYLEMIVRRAFNWLIPELRVSSAVFLKPTNIVIVCPFENVLICFICNSLDDTHIIRYWCSFITSFSYPFVSLRHMLAPWKPF